MKKNTMMRIASFLLIAVLLSTSAISGTYAKYVTEGTGKDAARVAKFGVVVTADSEIFDSKYSTDETGANAYTGEFSVKVEASSQDDLVAPGTTKTMANVGITGTPEVAVRISNKVNEFTIGENWKDADDNFYCPLIITVTDAEGASHVISGLTCTDAADFEAKVIEAIENATQDYDPNTVLDDLNNDEILQITWEWPFSTSPANDIKDTYLGDQAADGNAATISINVTTFVTQID